MPSPSRVLTEAVLADRTDSSERIDFNDIFLWMQDEPSAAVHSQDVLFQMSPPEEPETTRMTTRVSTEAEVAVVTDSSERIDFNDVLLRQQDVLFQVSPPEEPEMPSHVSTETEIVDSLGRINFDELTNVQPQNDVVQPLPRLRMTSRALTPAELDSFTDSSGVIDMFAVLLSQQNDPAWYQSQDDIPPSQQSEMPSLQDVFAAFTGISGRSEFDAYVLSYQSKDLSNLRGLPG